jgi:Site-specific recombinases, DNA invertase Pin homologs
MKRKVVEILPTVHKTVQDTKETLRIAAYCRVSTDSNDQENSLENQINEFKKSIDRHEGWELVKVYSDKGISGKSAQNRPGFLEMIQDSRDGKIDRIITKSISRFARNTRDTIDYVRMLR